MSISFSCTHCGKAISVRDEFAGKRGKCPGCQQLVVIPAKAGSAAAPLPQAKPKAPTPAMSTSVPAARTPSTASVKKPAAPTVGNLDPAKVAKQAAKQQRAAGMSGILKYVPDEALAFHGMTPVQVKDHILGAFNGGLEPLKISFVSKMGLFLATLFCIWVAISPWLTIAAVVGGCAAWAIFGGQVIAAAIVGLIVVPLLARPLFAAGTPKRRTMPVPREADPLLWAFVERICEALQAPQPKQIEIDCSFEAYGKGPSLLSKNLTVVFGLPLAGTLTTTQFAGVLARQIGQFRNNDCLGCKATMKSIHDWLGRLAFEPDGLDRWLAKKGIVFKILLFPLTAGDFIVRKYYWLLFELVQLAAFNVLRAREQQADRCQAQVAGSKTFVNLFGKLQLLNYAWQGVQADIPMRFHEKHLYDNLIAAIVKNLEETPEEVREIIMQQHDATLRPSHDACPNDAERIAAVEKLAATGIFDCSFPASTLFQDLTKTSKAMTWDNYHTRYGSKVRQHELQSAE